MLLIGAASSLIMPMVAPHRSRASGNKSGNALSLHLIFYLPAVAANWAALNLKNALIINVVLAVFNLFLAAPLDGGCIYRGLLPNVLAKNFARLGPYGLMILIGLLIVLALAGSQFGVGLGFVSHLISAATNTVVQIILQLAANI